MRARRSRRFGLLVFVGAEILTREGDLLIFGLDGVPLEQLKTAALIEEVEDRSW